MKEKWQNLNSREQQLVIAMSIAVICFLFVNLIWQPLNDNIAKAEKKLARQQELLVWVDEKTSLVKASKGKSTSRGGSLSSIVNRTAKANKVNITRIQPQGESIQIWIDEVVFVNLLQWLNQLVISEGVSVTAIDLSATETPGITKVRRLQLGRN